MAKLGDLITTCNGRLTLTSGSPVTTSDVTAATTLYFTPYKGDHIAIYDGEEWLFYQFEEISLSLSSYAADTNFDIFIYDNAGTLTLESVAWTDDTTRATALTTQNGVYVKSGDTTRRYLGTIRTTGTIGQCEDSVTKRFVWNYYNRKQRRLYKLFGGSWTYATATFRLIENDSTNRFSIVTGLAEDLLQLSIGVRCQIQGNEGYKISFSYDSTTTISWWGGQMFQWADSSDQVQYHVITIPHSLGYHYYGMLESTYNTNTVQLYGGQAMGFGYG